MFRPNCRAIFGPVFEKVECMIDNALNLQDLVLQELVKTIVFFLNIKLKIKIQVWHFIQ